MKPIKLDMVTLLPKVRSAYRRKRLQFQTSSHDWCQYAGPCAIGVGVPPSRRKELDSAYKITQIGHLIHEKAVIVPRGQGRDFTILQKAHDGVMEGGTEARFLRTLERLEAKYLPE